MALTPGDRLGSHEIIELLGAGGMGEVYRARDTKLNREVAIKILPDAYAADPERIARFHREAQAVAALNHTSIAAIYDLAETPATESAQTPIKFLVLELIEGDTLADRIRRGPVPIEEALQIAKQILEALEVAHERGVCHRDLKPANIKLAPGGTVKVLDFGLAKFLQSGPSTAGMTHSPTLSLAGTYPGVILGTAGYMAPEQAKGFEADQRSDIFSFGCILYEMLTGRQAFEGDSASEILASVIKSEADVAQLPPRLNPRLVEVLRRCLEKNPKKRYHAAADVRVEIEALAGRGIVVEEPRAAAAPPRPLWKRAIAPTLSALVVGTLAAYAAWTLKPEGPKLITRFALPLPEGQTFTNTGRIVVALSPDGANLVYVANQRLYLRPLAAVDARVISGSESAAGILNPAFSPDGKDIVFRTNADSALRRIAVSGGSPMTICPAEPIYGIQWTENGILFGQAGKGIMRVSPNGGTPEIVAAVDKDELADQPQLLPGGRAVLFSTRKLSENWDQGRLVVQPLGGGERKTVVTGAADGRYLPTGHLVYALSGILLAVPFDLESLAVRGGPVPILEGIRRGGLTSAATGVAQMTFSGTGSMVYLPGPATLGSAAETDLALFDLTKGDAQPLKLPPAAYRAPRVSPDGKRIVFESDDGKTAFIGVYDLDGRTAVRRLTFDGQSRAPVWSPDGQWIAFQSDRERDFAIFRQRADGSGVAERLTKPDGGTGHTPQSWSRDGARLVFSLDKGADNSQSTLWILDLADRKVSQLGAMPSREASFSPDGRWIAYQTRGATVGEVYVEPFPRTGAKYLVPQPGGHPYWSPKGDAILLNSGPTRSTMIAVATAPRLEFGKPVEVARLGRVEPNPATGRRNADMMPDGSHVIGVMSGPGATAADTFAARMFVVLNWFEEVKQRVPVQ